VVSVITVFAFEAIATATAMPIIAADLGLLGAYTWAFSAFVVASLFGMVAGGVWSDAIGPRQPVIVGVVTLGLGSIVAGLATGLASLVVGRSLQGLGGGVILVAVYVLIARAYDVEARPRAFSVLAAAWVVPSLVGPLVAGWLAQDVNWRAVFLLVPVVLVLPMTLLLPRLRAYEGGTRGRPIRGRLLAGAITAAGLLAIQGGVLELSWQGAALELVGVLAVGLSVRVLLPPGGLTFRRGLPTSVMIRGFLGGAFYAAEVFVPLALTQTRGISVTQAGLILATSAAFWAVGSYAQSRLPGERDRSSAVRLGAAIVAVSLLGLPLALWDVVPPWVAAIFWASGAVGMGLAIPSISVQVMRLSPPDDLGRNSSAIQIADSIGITLAVSLAGLGHAAAVAGGGATAGTYLLLWVGSAMLGLLAVGLAGRMTPRAVPSPIA
jgi:MFS family permease